MLSGFPGIYQGDLRFSLEGDLLKSNLFLQQESGLISVSFFSD
jgi:hypothetical protein